MSDASDRAMGDDELARWSRALGTLSLDLTRGLYQPMGLFVPDEEAFRERVRGAIVDARSRGEPDARAAVAGLVERFLGAVREEHGDDFARYLAAWESDAFFGDPWRFAQPFRWALLVGTRSKDGEPRLPALVVSVRRELAEGGTPLVPRWPESEWDRDYFERHGYSANDTGPNPMDAVENTIAHVAFCRAFEKAVRQSTSPEADLDELFEWGKQEGSRRNIAPERLERPGGWPQPPRQ